MITLLSTFTKHASGGVMQIQQQKIIRVLHRKCITLIKMLAITKHFSALFRLLNKATSLTRPTFCIIQLIVYLAKIMIMNL